MQPQLTELTERSRMIHLEEDKRVAGSRISFIDWSKIMPHNALDDIGNGQFFPRVKN